MSKALWIKENLKRGEQYAGIILQKDGNYYHLVLLEGAAEEIDFSDALDWAKGKGGELPTRSEQALLYANLKDQFKGTWHWSCEQNAALPDYAWVQHFSSGDQDNGHKSYEYRARAVRRIYIDERVAT